MHHMNIFLCIHLGFFSDKRHIQFFLLNEKENQNESKNIFSFFFALFLQLLNERDIYIYVMNTMNNK